MEGKEVGRLVVGQDLFGASEHTLPHARTNTHKHTHSVKVKTHTHTHTHAHTHKDALGHRHGNHVVNMHESVKNKRQSKQNNSRLVFYRVYGLNGKSI